MSLFTASGNDSRKSFALQMMKKQWHKTAESNLRDAWNYQLVHQEDGIARVDFLPPLSCGSSFVVPQRSSGAWSFPPVAAPEKLQQESSVFFSRLRRAEIGIHHHISGQYLSAYASEMAWREDHRRVSNGEQFLMATGAALAHPVSRQWKGYWQRRTL